jgi:hypothetical protein
MAEADGDIVKGSHDWGLHGEAERQLLGLVNGFLSHHPVAAGLRERIEAETSTRFLDWVDHIALPESDESVDALVRAGLEVLPEAKVPDGHRLLRVPKSTLLPVVVGPSKDTALTLRVEQLEAFQAVHAWDRPIECPTWAPLRRLEVARNHARVLVAVERRGYRGFVPDQPADDLQSYAKAYRSLWVRKREFPGEDEGLRATEDLVRRILSELSPSRAADAFFRAERRYWESRNDIGRHQRERQDHLGLGWANADHHTFRCSREYFKDTLHILGMLGMVPRERFYAGEQAGWGAQVLEHTGCGAVVFADVDLAPEERGGDFTRSAMRPLDRLGTIGLWVGLHGESLLEAGMHHLAGRIAVDRLGSDLAPRGFGVMPPFSEFPFLRQAFTQAQVWRVAEDRIGVLADRGLADDGQLDAFRRNGAVGSHLEATERREGFKGFNQDSVSVIIRATDPRA